MYQKIIYNPEALLKSIKELLVDKEIFIVAIDGLDGVGKSYLSKLLSKNLKTELIELDDSRYLNKNKGGYVEWINYPHLKDDLDLCKRDNKITIVEGICILEILERVDYEPSLHIYLKKTKGCIWESGEDFDYSKNINQVLKEYHMNVEETTKMFNQSVSDTVNDVHIGIDFSNSTPSGKLNLSKKNRINLESDNLENLEVELLQYHFKYQPDKSAHIIYNRE